MKIALVVPGGVDESGVDRVVPAFCWLIERLSRRHELHVFAMHHEPEARDWDLFEARVHNIGTRAWRRVRFLRGFTREHARGRFDVVHAFFSGTAPLAALTARLHRLPFVLHLAGGELVAIPQAGYGVQRSARSRAALRAVTALADRVTVATRHMQGLAAQRGIHAGLVPLGVALDRWPPRAPVARPSDRPAMLLHVADVRPVKDQQTLLAAAALLRDRSVKFELHLAGFDTTEGALRKTAAARAVADVTHWHGLLRRDALRALAERCDLLLHTSRHEAGPLAVLEAAVLGIPTVGTAVGQVADWAPDAAVAVPVGDAEALARETIRVLEDEPRRLALGRRAQERAIASDADATADAFERLYRCVRHG